ncbi:hypothetical protein KEM55_005098 [Ascosphaera atra]|nr:hypothetical protein KEM55_005098 [Ascosphaera atra]
MADPNVAVQQQEPSAAALEKSNMAALSAQQHKDIYGNIINRAELESEMDYAGGGPVQPPNNPYGYNYPAGASRPGGPPMPTQPSSQAGMAWASAPPKIAPPRKPVVSGPDEKKRGFFRRKGKK